jgi:hypothetical protein
MSATTFIPNDLSSAAGDDDLRVGMRNAGRAAAPVFDADGAAS